MSLSAPKAAGEMVSLPRYLLEESPALAKKIQEFDDAQVRAAEAIALIGAADEIQGLLEQAKTERDAVDVASAAVRKNNIETIATAEAEAADILATAGREYDEKILSAESKLESARRVEESAQLKMNEAQAAEAVATAREINQERERLRLAARNDELEALSTQLLKEKSALATVREQIGAVLGEVVYGAYCDRSP